MVAETINETLGGAISGVPDPAAVLDLFTPPIRKWFCERVGRPTPPQVLGWPAIHRGDHTLILAPTGSGKTLAAFLACLDQLCRGPLPKDQVQLLYVSPLKALNQDIQRNLRVPLQGVAAAAGELGLDHPELRIAVRTGDTTAAERQALVRRPPHVLITTPESLNLVLTSAARAMLTHLRWCVVDEIHVLCPNKRGVFLALLLERLSALQQGPDFVRIGLSATQRPLDEVARYLGGGTRPVTIVDAGLRKNLDLQVIAPVETFGPLPERTVWPSIYRLLLDQIRTHRSTLIFANSRRTVERVANELNELAAETPTPADASPLAPMRPHHGSLSQEARFATEQALKMGELSAVVATASLELGIDMGAVDLVCQIESPGQVARSLQRVGRAGHLVGQTSKGRLIPKTKADLLEQAVVAREMRLGRVEELRVPTLCLDVLAQQIVAMVAVQSWDVPELLRVLRQAYPYRDLTAEALESVLEMLAGRFPDEAFRELRARLSWDRIHNRLHPLPGSKQLALINGGTIPDTGQFAAYITGTEVRIGELDEEFVYERRLGDVFQLGSHAWRIDEIGSDRVHVSRADGLPPLMPFWRGERAARSPDLGLAIGRFLRELEDRLDQSPAAIRAWLREECSLDEAAARNLLDYVRLQIETAGCLPSDQTLLVEAFRDQLGDWHVAILAPLGGHFHFTLRLALEARWRQRYGYQPQCLHLEDGLLLKLVDVDEPPLDLLDDLDPDRLEDLVLSELGDSALFAIRFRHNAMRSLLMPRLRPDRRAPLWLQRLKARSLLQICRQHPRFPVVLETFRECLHDHLDVPRVAALLRAVRAGQVRVERRQADQPCPFAAPLLFQFTAAFMYIYDRTDATPATAELDRGLLDQLLLGSAERGQLIDERTVWEVEGRIGRRGLVPRTKEELAERLRQVGDLRPSEVDSSCQSFLTELTAERRAALLTLPAVQEPDGWVHAEYEADYRLAFGLEASAGDSTRAAESILRRFLLSHALVGLADVIDRYPFDPAWARHQLESWSRAGQAVRLQRSDADDGLRWSAPGHFEELQRTALATRRREMPTVSRQRYADFLLRWQHRHPRSQKAGPEGLRQVLLRLQGLPLPSELWEQSVLPGRVPDYQARWLDELTVSGEWTWRLSGDGLLAFFLRDEVLRERPPVREQPLNPLAARVREHLEQHGAGFIVDMAAATGLPAPAVRGALWELARAGLAANDRFDVVRRGPEAEDEPVPTVRSAGALAALRRRRSQRPEGRWALLPWGEPETEPLALLQASRLLDRYGIVARELARQDDTLLPWRVLYEVFSRLELTGEVRRGYFVEGLSGAQFALPEALRELEESLAVPLDRQPAMLLHSCDPANLWGSHAPFATRPGSDAASGDDDAIAPTVRRRPRNWLVVRGGRPVLLAEQQGRRLTTWPDAGTDDLAAAVATLGDVLRTGHGLNLRGKLTIDLWNGQPVVESPGRALLEAVGFVRDYQSLALYAVHR